MQRPDSSPLGVWFVLTRRVVSSPDLYSVPKLVDLGSSETYYSFYEEENERDIFSTHLSPFGSQYPLAFLKPGHRLPSCSRWLEHTESIISLQLETGFLRHFHSSHLLRVVARFVSESLLQVFCSLSFAPE
ncbi:hypothetical protein BDW75DRAFT_146128 [Aspergillus navahoensis]